MAFDMPRANKPEDVGLSSPRLQRIRDTLQADVDKGAVPGAVMLIARRGQIASLEALGYRDREDGAVMRPDTIFRIASMTKPVTSVAAMMLAEEGKRQSQGRHQFRRCDREYAGGRAAATRDDRAGSAAAHLRPDLRASHRPTYQAGLRSREC
ncbi:MAG: serine hydrolase domain-containing protein, partial [Pseudolabrys sp.]